MPERLPPRTQPAVPLYQEPDPEPDSPSAPAQQAPRAPLPRPPSAAAPNVGPAPAPATGAGQFDLFTRRAASPRPLSVSELTREVKGILEGRFVQLLVSGELSNLNVQSSGHCYFTLKDEYASIACVLFRTEARRLRFTPRDGLTVLARGRLSLYEPQGRYQLICDSLEPLGAGALQLALEQLKEKLQKEGLFDRARKRKLPPLPKRIAIVTSPSGAAVHDFIRVLHRRYPNLSVLVVPARVQGDGAAQEIARAIQRAAAQPEVDVVVVARGGGSAEDLWSFNEEVVARALARCPVPTVSAVGHEVDTTLADLVADVRAPTPTAAAELLAPVKEELVAELSAQRARLVRSVRGLLERRRNLLDTSRARLTDPRRLIGERKLRLDKLAQRLEERMKSQLERRVLKLRANRERLDRAHPRLALHRMVREVARLEQSLGAIIHRRLAERRARFEQAVSRLDAMSPLRVLGRGYAVAFDSRGHALTDAGQANPGDAITVRLAKGALAARIESRLAGTEPESSDSASLAIANDAGSSGER